MSDRPGVCIHGSLRRSCETCDLAERLDATERERDEARADHQRTRNEWNKKWADAGHAAAALQAELDEARAMNARSICVWCGTILPCPDAGTPEARVRVMWEHAEGCDARPEKRLAVALDDARALLRECLTWFNEGPDADRPDDLCGRIDAALGGRDE